MKFRLLYEGPIAPWSKAKLMDIHEIRRKLDPQLRELWHHQPLSEDASKFLRPFDPNDATTIGLQEKRGETIFAPIVSKRIDLCCDLEITFLRKQAPGQLIGDGGDIDNRVKTLLDALSVPPMAQQREFRPATSSDPIYCLLQDDSLVTKLSVETDRLLRATDGEHDLVAIIQVKVSATRLSFANMSIVN
jgi:hypothetical protein